jgi:hypothetical protein
MRDGPEEPLVSRWRVRRYVTRFLKMERGLEVAVGAVGLLGLLVNVGVGSDSLEAAKWGAVIFLCATILVVCLESGCGFWTAFRQTITHRGPRHPRPCRPTGCERARTIRRRDPPDDRRGTDVRAHAGVPVRGADFYATVHPVEPRPLERHWRLAVDVVAPTVGAEIVVFAGGAWEVTVRDRSDEFLEHDYAYGTGNPPDFAANYDDAYGTIVQAVDEASNRERAGASGGAPPCWSLASLRRTSPRSRSPAPDD